MEIDCPLSSFNGRTPDFGSGLKQSRGLGTYSVRDNRVHANQPSVDEFFLTMVCEVFVSAVLKFYDVLPVQKKTPGIRPGAKSTVNRENNGSLVKPRAIGVV